MAATISARLEIPKYLSRHFFMKKNIIWKKCLMWNVFWHILKSWMTFLVRAEYPFKFNNLVYTCEMSSFFQWQTWVWKNQNLRMNQNLICPWTFLLLLIFPYHLWMTYLLRVTLDYTVHFINRHFTVGWDWSIKLKNNDEPVSICWHCSHVWLSVIHVLSI